MKIKDMTKIFKINDENKTKVIGLLTILISFWLILYLIPELFVSLFNTLLGNLILITSVLLIYMNNRTYGLITGLIFIIFFRFSQLSKEGFTQDSQNNFLKIQNTINKQKVFDMDVIGTQASQQELDYFNENGMWPWSQNTIDLYETSINRNSYIRTDAEQATNYARTIYNEAAILQILSYQTKEGQFLLNGVLVKDNNSTNKNLPSGFGDFGYNSGLVKDKSYDIIKCNLNDNSLERIEHIGQDEKKSRVDYNDLENLIPGFTFLNSPCNPCKAMNASPDYSCPFELKLKNKSSISAVWQYLWGT